MIRLNPSMVTLDLTNERNLDVGVEAHPDDGTQCGYIDTEKARVWITLPQARELYQLLAASMGEAGPAHTVAADDHPWRHHLDGSPIK